MSKDLLKLMEEVEVRAGSRDFIPDHLQRQAKASFWAHFLNEGTTPALPISPNTATNISGYSQVGSWYKIPGFQEWFSNSEEFRQRTEYTAHLAVDVIQGILQDVESKPADKLKAAQLALQIAAKFPSSSGPDKYMDAAIAEMSKAELEKFIATKLQVVELPEEKK